MRISMIFCSGFPTRECEDKGQSSTVWVVGELSISSLSLVWHGRTPGKTLGQATVTATLRQRRWGWKEAEVPWLLHSAEGSHLLQEPAGWGQLFSWRISCVWSSRSRTWRESTVLCWRNGWAARASATVRTPSVPPCFILQRYSCPQGTRRSGRSPPVLCYAVA